ncbi:hypothetical protein M513_13635 [Trichuris suis]|uniref:Uncharacterized protein n=1 Tax=Trichuris suis TaxID=68888 RepID=A0A085LKJ0_9BILA|nr:hypothetical protein M513_13635 [Trichuris suis]
MKNPSSRHQRCFQSNQSGTRHRLKMLLMTGTVDSQVDASFVMNCVALIILKTGVAALMLTAIA